MDGHPPARPASETASPARRLPRSFYERDTVTVARALLGQRLVRQLPDGQRLAGTIVETEAYLGPEDQTAHTANHRRTPRNEVMHGPAGYAYVYFTYGMHHCVNAVTRGPGVPQAVLIRALEPTEGLDAIQAHRPTARRREDLGSGPAKLTQALKIDLNLNGTDLVEGANLGVEQLRTRALPSRKIAVSARIGVQYAGDWALAPLRFWVRDHPHVSRGRPSDATPPAQC